MKLGLILQLYAEISVGFGQSSTGDNKETLQIVGNLVTCKIKYRVFHDLWTLLQEVIP